MAILSQLLQRLCDADVDFVVGSMELEVFGKRCRVISLDDLIRAKEAMGREKDLLAVKELRAIHEKTK